MRKGHIVPLLFLRCPLLAAPSRGQRFLLQEPLPYASAAVRQYPPAQPDQFLELHTMRQAASLTLSAAIGCQSAGG